ncbi:MAG: hypothetical protein R3F33_02050 [Planctomycetota bacterium]
MNPNPIQGAGGPQGRNSAQPISRKQETAAPAFRALLEQLESHSQGLAQRSEHLTDGAQLQDAVGQSEVVLEQVRQLTDQLLEAFRAEQQRRA